MKKILKRGLALCLALALAVAPALASDALGTELKGRTIPLAQGAAVTDNSLWSATYSDLRTERYITYQPNSTVTPVVWYGSVISSTGRLTAAAESLAAQGYRVVAGINGGFYNSDGTAVGLVLTDGVIRSLDQWNYSMVGMCADGTIFIDKSTITKTVRWTDFNGMPVSLTVTAVNESRKNGGLYFYSEDYGASTKNTLGGVDVTLAPVLPGQGLRMNSTMEFQVVQVTDSTQEGVQADNVIPAGGFVLSANQNCGPELLDPLRALTPGSVVTLDITGGDPRWADAVYGVTGLYSLVENGQVVSGLEAGSAPRTAIGLRPDGTALFYTIDGRQSGHSVGASYTQVATRLTELGCIQAVALDGGGSTTLGATLPGDTTFSVLNSPSGGNQRSVSNCVLLVTTAQNTGMADRFYVEAASDVVLAGAQTQLTAQAVDMNGYAAFSSGGADWWSDGGSVNIDYDGNAVFTAGTQAGSFDVTASSMGITGSAPIRVVDRLSSLSVIQRDTGRTPSSLLLEPGDQVELDASGKWYNLPVAMDDSNVIWSTTGNVGSITADGLFTAGENNAEGTIIAQAGDRTVTIPVKVDRGDPFADAIDHWSRDFVAELYKLGLTTGTLQPDGTYLFEPDSYVSRGQLLVFISRLLGVDTSQYAWVELPFEDLASIDDWMLPDVKAMYALQVFNGTENGGVIRANVSDRVTREAAMTMLGRVLADQLSCDLSIFADHQQVSDWAMLYVQTLVAQQIVSGNEGLLSPGNHITRGEIAKILTLVSVLPRAELTVRGEQPQTPEQPEEPEAPAEPEVPAQPEQPTEPEVPAQPEQPEEPESPVPDPTQPGDVPQDPIPELPPWL